MMGLYTFFNAGEVTAAGVCFPIVGAILVAFRIRIRLMKMKRLGIEDWLVFPALVCISSVPDMSVDASNLYPSRHCQ